MWFPLSGRPLSAQCCHMKKLSAARHLLTSISMLVQMCLWPASENIWLSLGWSTRTQNSWRTVQGLMVVMEQDEIQWKQGSMVPDTPNIITWWTVLSLGGRLVRPHLVCTWLHVACRILKRRGSLVTKDFNDEMRDILL